MKFQFPVTANWKVNNTPSQVQMYNEKQDAIILFSLAKANSPLVAANEFVGQTKAVIKTSNQIRVNYILTLNEYTISAPHKSTSSPPT